MDVVIIFLNKYVKIVVVWSNGRLYDTVVCSENNNINKIKYLTK